MARPPKDRQQRVQSALTDLMAGLEANAKARVEALLETALDAARERDIADLWDQPELCRSYWVLMISGINSPEEMRIADEILRWRAFFAKDSAAVLCVQTSERHQFQCCVTSFDVRHYPCLILGCSPEMQEYVKFEPQLLFALADERGAFHRLVTALHSTVEGAGSLDPVRTTLDEVRFWKDLQIGDENIRGFSFSPAVRPRFDVFLSHNSKDKRTVRRLARALQARGLTVWLDERELVPGRPWQEALESVISTTRTALVLVGRDGLGPWEAPEMRGCITQFVQRRMPVIPVLLPGAERAPDLPLFLQGFTWVDLRQGLTKAAVDQLVWGVTGRSPLDDL